MANQADRELINKFFQMLDDNQFISAVADHFIQEGVDITNDMLLDGDVFNGTNMPDFNDVKTNAIMNLTARTEQLERYVTMEIQNRQQKTVNQIKLK